MKIYSPSETADYKRCPRLWALRREGYRSRYVGYPDTYAATGTGIHKVAELAHKLVRDGSEGRSQIVDPQVSAFFVEQGKAAGVQSVRRLVEAGALPESKLEDWENRVADGVRRGGLAYLSAFNSLIPREWQIREAELVFGGGERGDDTYEGTADLLLSDDYGLAIADIKTKQPFKQDFYREQFISQFAHAWQLYHYSFLVKQYYGELPKRFYLLMVELNPVPRVTMHPYRLDLDYMRAWEHTVTKLWAEMERIEAGMEVPGISNDHTAYGKLCPFYAACMDYKLDESLMQHHYIQLG